MKNKNTHIGENKKKGSHTLEFHLNDEFKQVFIGKHTLFSVLGFTVGGILVGGTLEKILHQAVGQGLTLVIGIILLLMSGLVLKQFND